MLEVYPNDKRTRPHSAVTIDSSRLGANSSNSQKALVVFGSAQSGIPGELYHLTSFPQAKSIFKGGELLDFIEVAWSPSDVSAGAGDIYAMRVDSAQAASIEVGDLLIQSVQYGADANKVAVKLEPGTLANSFKFTAIDTATSGTEVYDNLGPILDLQYVGSAKVAKADVTDGFLTVKVGDTANSLTNLVSFDLSAHMYATADRLVSALNATGDISASLIPNGDKAIDSADLDSLASVDVKSAPITLAGLAGDLIHQTEWSNIVNITKKVEAPDTLTVTPGVDSVTLTSESASSAVPLAPFSLRNLEKGTNGTVPTSWEPLFRKLANEDAPYAYYVVALTPNQAIHQELSSFINEQSSAGYPLRAIVGGALGENVTKTLARKSALFDSRIALVGFDAEIKMADGRVALFPAYMATALVAGIVSGLPVGEPATYKQVRIASLKRQYTSDQLDQLHTAGVIVVEKVRNIGSSSFRIVSDVTTYNDVNNPVESQMSLGEETDYLANELREMLDTTFIGTRTSALTASIIKASIDTFLSQQVSRGTIQSYTASDIAVTIIGDSANISFVVVPARGLNTIKVGIIYDTNTVTA